VADPPSAPLDATAAAPGGVEAAVPASGLLGRFSASPLARTFAIRDFRLYWAGALAYSVVVGSQRFVFVWLVLDISDRAGLAGIVGFALGIPAFFITLPAGVWADRVHRGRMVAITAAGSAVVAIALAAAIWLSVVSVGVALVGALAMGTMGAGTQPPLAAIVPSIVPRDRLVNAIVLRTMGQNLAQILGASIGGAAIALWGFGGAFSVQALCYATAALLMLAVRVPPTASTADGPRPAMLAQLREGLAFVFRDPALRALMFIMLVSGLFMLGPVFVLIPQIARDRLGQGAFSAGLLFAIMGAGMFVMSVILASMSRIDRKGRLFLLNMFVAGPVVAGMGIAPWYAGLAALMFAWGLGGGIFVSLNQTLLQLNAPDRVMGRVMSISALSIAGLIPLGSLLAGAMAEVIGAEAYMVCCGAAIVAAAALAFTTQGALRRMD
jgi:predicted MFS family arabinose efflux permease